MVKLTRVPKIRTPNYKIVIDFKLQDIFNSIRRISYFGAEKLTI